MRPYGQFNDILSGEKHMRETRRLSGEHYSGTWDYSGSYHYSGTVVRIIPVVRAFRVPHGASFLLVEL